MNRPLLSIEDNDPALTFNDHSSPLSRLASPPTDSLILVVSILQFGHVGELVEGRPIVVLDLRTAEELDRRREQRLKSGWCPDIHNLQTKTGSIVTICKCGGIVCSASEVAAKASGPGSLFAREKVYLPDVDTSEGIFLAGVATYRACLRIVCDEVGQVCCKFVNLLGITAGTGVEVVGNSLCSLSIQPIFVRIDAYHTSYPGVYFRLLSGPVTANQDLKTCRVV